MKGHYIQQYSNTTMMLITKKKKQHIIFTAFMKYLTTYQIQS